MGSTSQADKKYSGLYAQAHAKDHVYDFTYDIVTELERCGCSHCQQLLKNTRRGNVQHIEESK